MIDGIFICILIHEGIRDVMRHDKNRMASSNNKYNIHDIILLSHQN